MNGIATRVAKRYFITFIDDCFRYTYIYLIKTKDEVLSKLKIFKTEVDNTKQKLTLRLDRRGEYTLNEFTNYCEKQCIVH